MNPIDYMELLGALPDDLVDCAFSHQAKAAGSAVPQEHAPITVQVKTGTAIPLKKRGSVWAPRIVSGAAAAACLAVVCGMGILLRDDGMTMQTSTMETAVAPETERPAATTAPAVTAAPERSEVPAQTAQTVQTTAALPAETTAQPAETAPAATEAPAAAAPAETTPAETTPAPAETAPAETAPAPAEPQTPVFELGDVDMDGKITFVDAALVSIEWNLANNEHLERSLLTDEQRALGNVNGHDDNLLTIDEDQFFEEVDEKTGRVDIYNKMKQFPLGTEDYLIIKAVADLRNWYDADISTAEYQELKNNNPELLNELYTSKKPMSEEQIKAHRLLDKMTLALWGTTEEYPDGTVIQNEDGSPLISAEDFWHMAEEMLTYFKDAQ